MTTPAQKPSGTGGGSIAIRGFLAQTLVALLDVVQADPPFTEVTLEPIVGGDQFDFMWKDRTGTYAVQVKSTTNLFKKPGVEEWARKLEAARSNEHCRLMLVGIIHPSLGRISRVGNVVIEKKNLDLPGLLNEAAQGVAMFRDAVGLEPRSGAENLLAAKALVTELELYATQSRRLIREAFIKLLRQWVITAPRHEPKFDISRIIEYAPKTKLIGREAETKLLNDAWAKVRRGTKRSRPHVLTFVALTGEGKTSLVAKWAVDLQVKSWPGCDAAFAWSFYRQGMRDQAEASSEPFLEEALTFFGDAAVAGSAQGASDKGRRLAQLVGERRALLILDGLEPLQYAPTSPRRGELKDQGLATLLKELVATCQGLCVVTTQYSIPDLRAYRQIWASEVDLPRLSRQAGVTLLQSFEVKGSLRKVIPSTDGGELLNEFEKLVEDVKGHALTLNLLGSYLRDAYGGDIRQRDRVKLADADAAEQGGHAFRVMDAYVRWFNGEGENGQRALALLGLLGVFDRPATADCLADLWKGDVIPWLTEPLVGLTEAQRNMALTRLESAKLLTVNRDAASRLVSLDSHQIIREYFAQQLQQHQPEAWRAAHQRLYEYLTSSVAEYRPDTLEGLQRLYQAVAHGCQAGLQQQALTDVFRKRIWRESPKGELEFFSTKTLGATGTELAVLQHFFEEIWAKPSEKLNVSSQALVLHAAGFRLRTRADWKRATDALHAARDKYKQVKEWREAAECEGNLNEVCIARGDLKKAVVHGRESVGLVDRAHPSDAQWDRRAEYARALHLIGEWSNAAEVFRGAENILQSRPEHTKWLYSLAGFYYCDFLLDRMGDRNTFDDRSRFEEVKKRAEAALIQTGGYLRDIALCNLVLGRAHLLTPAPHSASVESTARKCLETAVDSSRKAGRSEYLCAALLTRAAMHKMPRDSPCAKNDLDEAWEIAERGPMPLFQADIHLYRARLFHAVTSYPWDKDPQGKPRGEKDDLAAARKLIEQCGYHRRDEELADAEEAAKSW